VAKQESYFGPFPPKPEPEEHGTPCPNCGGPRLARDADRWCENCRKGIGCYAEFVCGWYTELVPAKDTSADWRESQRRKLPDFYEFSELAREAVGDAEFTEATLKKLEALLLRPKIDGGMFDAEDRELLLRTPRSQIMAFLRKRLQGDGGNGGNVHAPDFRSVRWNGKIFSFTIAQSKVVAALWEAWKLGTPEVGAETLLQAIDHEAPPARLDITFRGHPAWKTMIVPGSTKGAYRLADKK